MEYIELVIKIPQRWFDDMVREEFIDVDELCALIQHSTILPKGHGRLIDADALNRKDVNCANVPMNFIDTAPTIIAADKEK